MQTTPAPCTIDKRAHPPPDFMVCSPLKAPPRYLAEGKALATGVELSILTEPPTGQVADIRFFQEIEASSALGDVGAAFRTDSAFA
jgi:hypothetical protein